ncbi:sodium:proton exchanger [Paenibacillus swuensis]|uniref:Sodium:proton exchanger n=1 Tax=Paenibacillus swuensis TaxID=1178515 RepID=A0A172TGG9_9BACL|nr:sodium:proton antiporter [Paenibacillus swuensis]ANE46148.1 sodium:proton exchanger [Paenibacillus swuensis]
MVSETTELIHHVLLLLVFILVLGMISGKLASLLRVPDVVLFIAAGILVGPGLNIVHESSNSFTNQFILMLGSALILFDGGRNIRLLNLRKVWITISLLSVTGVFITVAVVGTAAHYLFGMEWLYALLLASIICSTDPASIIPVFKQVRIREKVRETVESESAFNDATGSIFTFTILAIILGGGGDFSWGASVWNFVKTAVGGILVGCVIAYVIALLTAHTRLSWFRNYTTIAMLTVAIGAYILGDTFKVSGFMATFSAGLIWGNAHLFGLRMEEKQAEMGHFSENLTVIMRMLIFVLLGSQVNFDLIAKFLWPSLGVILVLMFIARPLTVYSSTLPDRIAKWTSQEMLFMVWVRETGVIPAALAGIVAGLGIKYADVIASVTFMAILLTILIQASTTAYVARKLGLEVKSEKDTIGL